MSTARTLDQFYTARPIALRCFDFLRATAQLRKTDVFLEPSAGEGAFFDLMPAERRWGVDIDPKHSEVHTGDFLTEFVPGAEARRWIVVGNPPFGKNSCLAVKFFNRAAEFAEVVAFVVPMTFRKQSLQARLSPWFALAGEIDLPPQSFLFEGRPYSVPCCFQVWRRVSCPRVNLAGPLSHEDFAFCKDLEAAKFAIRRVGGLAGKVIRDFRRYAPTSHYFIQPCIDAELLIERFSFISWEGVKENTAGNPSISKRELVAKYTELSAPPTRRATSLQSGRIAVAA